MNLILIAIVLLITYLTIGFLVQEALRDYRAIKLFIRLHARELHWTLNEEEAIEESTIATRFLILFYWPRFIRFLIQ